MRSLRRHFRTMTNAPTVTISGVRLVSEQGKVPVMLRNHLYREVYEDTERNLLLRVLKPGMRVLEIGAGMGFISLLATKLSGEGNVVSYEANPVLEPLIRENYALNALAPQLRMKAVTLNGGPLSFFQSDNIISSSSHDRNMEARKITVESDAFANVLDEINPDVLVIDVEGAEVELFQIADLRNVRHIIIELHPHIVGEDKINQIIAGLESDGFVIRERDRKTYHFERTLRS
ncbi:FkbM family methyltransferase [Neorhizobium petrolearium]|uniref:FkbM family methyltransferase n=2 Tax=Neorhizobium petrolearium TaxID=515361 RepID=UPI003F5CD6DD